MTNAGDTASPIEVRDLTKTYRLGFFLHRHVRALQGLSLSIRAGEVFGLLGPNGAGKSTTIKILMNLVHATTGAATLFGKSPSHRDVRRMIGFVPENPAPYEYLTGREFVVLAARLAGLFGAELDKRVSAVLGDVGMDRAQHLQIRRYSKGMIQRVALAQALVAEPKLLILDEPTSGLDPVGRRQIRDLVLAERAKGTTILFCTHIIPDVEALCDRVAVLVSGKLVREGTVQELVTGQTSQVEMTVEGLSADAVSGLGVPLDQKQVLADRVLVRVADSDSDALLRRVLEANGRVTRLSPARFSLEDLFLQALQQAGGTVGGEMHL